ncbi:hypothetical protein GJAV_G00244620 [Gymnothorax javanicus]|nr:hypothetical protein GJAV_G00244620 [Gymnothorax javanicus]
MVPKKLRKGYQRSQSELDGQLSKEQRDQKKQLFMQQFEKEAQERSREMELEFEQLLATVHRAFRVEVMKLPPQLQNTHLNALMSETDEAPGEVTIAMKAQSPEIHRPLTRKTSKTVPARKNATRLKRVLSDTKTPILSESKKPPKSRSLVALSSATKGQRSRHSPGLSVKPFLTASATILTSSGEALYLSDEVKDDIDVNLLDETAVSQLHNLKQLLDYFCRKAKVNNSQ